MILHYILRGAGKLGLVFACLLCLSCQAAERPEGFVELVKLDPSIRLDIRYATTNNFTKQPVYPEARCFLRRAVAQRLIAVQKELRGMGLGLKVFDGYRPLAIQKKFWALVPDERYVANPAKGSRHNRGAAVDLTLIHADGSEVTMPTPYDDFTEKAHRDYMKLPAEALHNRELLERVMVKHGFIPFATEWWHFDAPGWESYPIMDLSFSELK